MAKAGPRYGRQLLFLLSVPVVPGRETAAADEDDAAPDEDAAAADEDEAAPDEDAAAATLRRQHMQQLLFTLPLCSFY